MSAAVCLTARALAQRADCSPAKLTRKIKSGEIVPDFCIGRAYAFSIDRIDELIAALQK